MSFDRSEFEVIRNAPDHRDSRLWPHRFGRFRSTHRCFHIGLTGPAEAHWWRIDLDFQIARPSWWSTAVWSAGHRSDRSGVIVWRECGEP